MSLLSVHELSFSYGEKRILDSIHLELCPGDFVGVLGPNGSGKTTLIRLLAGVLKPHAGEILLQDRPLSSFPAKQRARLIGVVPQEEEIFFSYTVREIVLMGRWAYSKPFAWETAEDLEIAEQAMREADCLQFADQKIVELSGGEKERVKIARALAQKPRILLLDEPTTHLDLKHQLQIARLLKRVQEIENLTLMMVIHDLNFAALTCRKILLLKEGKIVAAGLSSEVLNIKLLEEVFEVPLRIEEKNGSKTFSLRP